jgi:hypothetical protein
MRAMLPLMKNLDIKMIGSRKGDKKAYVDWTNLFIVHHQDFINLRSIQQKIDNKN